MKQELETALGDRFRIQREIGRGGMGTVFLARDLKHDRAVAVKVLRPDLARALGTRRFLREIQLSAQLQHPHIVSLIDSGAAGDLLYYLMPFVDGPTVRARLEQDAGRPLPLDETIRIASEVADALGYAHRHGVVHRDIKPENILLADGHAFVTDFGIARAIDVSAPPVTQAGLAVGTPAYMSPEQALGDCAVDGRTDLYALGCVLFEMLTGEPPFTGTTQQAVLMKRFTDSTPTVKTRRPDLPDWLDGLVSRVLARDPDDRPASAEAVAIELLAGAARASGTHATVRIALAEPAVRPETSIAVLPFANQSPDPADDYFSDGLTDELISDLSKVTALRVIARASSSRLKGSTKDIATIGRELDVRYALSGTVRRSGEALRITAELMDTASSRLTWSEKYTGTIADVFDLQERLSHQIVGALEVALTPDESRRMAAHSSMDIQAYECYLRARQEIMAFSAEGLDRAMNLVDRALAIAPAKPILHATRAYILAQYSMLALPTAVDPIARAAEAVRATFELDPESSLGLFVRGYVSFRSGRPEAAVLDFERALTQDPNNPDALFSLALVYGMAGQDRAARATHARLLAVDPLTPANQWLGGWLSCYDGRSEDLLAASRQWVLDDPSNPFVRATLAFALLLFRQVDEAKKQLDWVALRMPGPYTDSLLFVCHALMGQPDRALALVTDRLVGAGRADESIPIMLAGGYALLGNRARALEWLRTALDFGSMCHQFYRRCRWLQSLHGDPEFEAFVSLAASRSAAFQP